MRTMIKEVTMIMTEINKLIERIIKMITKRRTKMIITIKMVKNLTKMTIHLMKEIMMTITQSRLV
jgi:hypothetical protein